MNNITKRFILIFGLYLGWILSFTYEGPLFNVIIRINDYDVNLLFLAMHTLPLVIVALFIYKYIDKKTDTIWLYSLISASFVFSILFVVLGQSITGSFHFAILIILSVLIGMAEFLFIICCTGWYIRYVPVGQMFLAMAFITLIANAIVMICNILICCNLNFLSIAVSLGACLLALVFAVTLKKDSLNTRPHHHVEMPRNTIFYMCAAFYMFNVGGGVVFGVINPLITSSFGLIEVLNILPYLISCVLIIVFVKDNKADIQFFLIFATGMIVIGLILFQFIGNTSILLVSNTMIESGYAVMDVFMWGLVGLLAYVYNRPYKIVCFTMSANILGVVTGVILSKLLPGIHSPEESVPALVSLVCAIIGMLIIPIIYKKTIVNLSDNIAFLDSEQEKQNYLFKINNFENLTSREKEVAMCLTQDKTNRKIAAELYISENTLKTHSKNIYQKLAVKNKNELKLLFEQVKETELTDTLESGAES